jgi:hypothetical protein
LAAVIVTDNTLRQYEFDVSNYVKQEKALGHNVVSFMLKSPATTNSFLKFNSGNAASDQPKLAVATPLTVGIFKATSPPHEARVGQEVGIAVTWTVPVGGWRQLSSIELLVRDANDENSFSLLRFNESTNAFSLVNGAGALAGAVTLVPEKCRFQATGPASPTVTVTFTFRFKAAAAGHSVALAVFAENDLGSSSAFSRIGTIRVNP